MKKMETPPLNLVIKEMKKALHNHPSGTQLKVTLELDDNVHTLVLLMKKGKIEQSNNK